MLVDITEGEDVDSLYDGYADGTPVGKTLGQPLRLVVGRLDGELLEGKDIGSQEGSPLEGSPEGLLPVGVWVPVGVWEGCPDGCKNSEKLSAPSLLCPDVNSSE